MRWPPWSDSTPTTNDLKHKTQSLFSKDVLWPSVALSGTSLLLIGAYHRYARRIPNVDHIPHSYFRRRSLLGKVTSVGDGDNFRLYHTPGGRLLGWGWFPGRKIPTSRKKLKDQTIHIRVAGVDAPEAAHWGHDSQPYSAEALKWLKKYLVGRKVRAYLYRRDQYGRVVASAKVWRGLLKKDVGLQMLRAGIATVYKAKVGAEFESNAVKRRYERAEKWAKYWKKGMWKQETQGGYVSPHDHKKAQREKNK